MENSQPRICACMGPQGKDSECPCKMIAKGLQPHNIWDDETKKRFIYAIDAMFDRNKSQEIN